MTKTFKTISPVDDSVYLERQFADSKKIESALALSHSAQKKWRLTSIAERSEICRKAIDYFLMNAGAIGEEVSWQMGRPIRYAPLEITSGFQERANFMIEIADQALADDCLPEKTGFRRFIKREPLGTILVLAPWNYPYLTSVNAVIPAIMAGNSVILKHAQQTPLCAERYAAAFRHAGLPEGVFQFLHLEHAQIPRIINDQRIGFVAFTGSVAGGAAVQQAIGERFIGAGLELGGKDPAYVREDANLKDAIENLVDGAFFNSGQSCCGIERIYVDKKRYDEFLEGFLALTREYRLGNPLDKKTTLGPMVRPSAAVSAEDQIRRAIDQGATALIDPASFAAHQSGTAYMAPQVLIKVNHSMDIMTEESFAPVVGIMPVKNDDEAIQLMNDSQYGLTASIWTQDVENAIRIGDQIETGTFLMNRCDYLDPALAWTGVKKSGRGCTLSKLGYQALTRPKSFHLKLSSI